MKGLHSNVLKREKLKFALFFMVLTFFLLVPVGGAQPFTASRTEEEAWERNLQRVLPHSPLRHRSPLPPLPTYVKNRVNTRVAGETWSYHWAAPTWSESFAVPFEYDTLKVLLTANVNLMPSGSVAWTFDSSGKLTEFEFSMGLTTTVETHLEAAATIEFSKVWEVGLVDMSIPFSFTVGSIPVWFDLQITTTGNVSVDAYGGFAFAAGATTSSQFQVGVNWVRGYGWRSILDMERTVGDAFCTVEADAGAYVTAGLKSRLGILFYGVAGPFVEFEPYMAITVTGGYPPLNGAWELTANLKIDAGVVFSPRSNRYRNLDWAITLYDGTLAEWNGP